MYFNYTLLLNYHTIFINFPPVLITNNGYIVYTLSIETAISAAHLLRDYEGPCSRIHGHNWKIRVEVSANELDKHGIAIDFLDLKTAENIKPKMEAAMDKLTDAQKYVLHLSYYQGYTLGEISSKLNLPIEAVRVKMMGAVHNLRENLLGT